MAKELIFLDYLIEKRREEANHRLMMRILLEAKDSQDIHIIKHGSLAQAILYHTEDYMSAMINLQKVFGFSQ